jgi:hypothetical protein
MFRTIFRSSAIFTLALALLFSFAFHLVELHHDHPHAVFGDGIQAVFHGEDRKWAIPVIPPPISSGELSLLMFIMLATALFSRLVLERTVTQSRAHDQLREAFSSGILNPKLF